METPGAPAVSFPEATPPAENLYLLQEYRKPGLLKHPVFRPDGELASMNGRLRLCPYYFVEGDGVSLGGILATF